METIEITVKLFAIYQETCKTSELVLSFPAGTPVSGILDHLIDRHPELARWREVTRFGVNLQFVGGETRLENGDEVVLIPPVSGG
ncbi:MoaD/ThiS family protein [Pannus brasiliensis CCIBt3594]|uniref:Molybdopterin synthase sulfur carrier subunit n=1 Tax=Pannus brasiliensis CCIBt3594 TaxID=1427578 RepID=A0AAW9QSH0_9CHRO